MLRGSRAPALRATHGAPQHPQRGDGGPGFLSPRGDGPAPSSPRSLPGGGSAGSPTPGPTAAPRPRLLEEPQVPPKAGQEEREGAIPLLRWGHGWKSRQGGPAEPPQTRRALPTAEGKRGSWRRFNCVAAITSRLPGFGPIPRVPPRPSQPWLPDKPPPARAGCGTAAPSPAPTVAQQPREPRRAPRSLKNTICPSAAPRPGGAEETTPTCQRPLSSHTNPRLHTGISRSHRHLLALAWPWLQHPQRGHLCAEVTCTRALK